MTRPRTVSLALALVILAAASEGAGYFITARVTDVNADGTIDFWVISVHGLPREEPPASADDKPPLRKVIATLELKETRGSARDRSAELRGSRISLRGRCEDLERVELVPVIQVRLGRSRKWRQANLEPKSKVGNAGFKEIAARVCPSAATDVASPDSPDRRD